MLRVERDRRITVKVCACSRVVLALELLEDVAISLTNTIRIGLTVTVYRNTRNVTLGCLKASWICVPADYNEVCHHGDDVGPARGCVLLRGDVERRVVAEGVAFGQHLATPCLNVRGD